MLALQGDPAQLEAFTFESGCVEPLAVGQSCDVTLAFAPTVAAPHAVTLALESEASRASVLLLGEALVPGSLVLAAAEDSAAEFGDVEIGTSAERTFTLTSLCFSPIQFQSETRIASTARARLGPTTSRAVSGSIRTT